MQELLDVDAEDITSRLCLGLGWLSTEASRTVSTQQEGFFLPLFHLTVNPVYPVVTRDHDVCIIFSYVNFFQNMIEFPIGL